MTRQCTPPSVRVNKRFGGEPARDYDAALGRSGYDAALGRTSASLTSHSRRAVASSSACGRGFASLQRAKYLPVTPSTSGEDAAFSWTQTLYSERGTFIAILAGYLLLALKSRIF